VLAPLADATGSARIACFHLAAGESVGAHDAAIGQLFCVVAGEGWVSGDDDLATPLRATEAAYFAPGEHHAAGTDSGLVAVVIEAPAVEVLAARST